MSPDGLAFLSIGYHGAELVHLEDASLVPDPVLGIEDRSRRIEVDSDRDEGQGQVKEKQAQPRKGDIHQPLHRWAECTGASMLDRHGDVPAVAYVFHRDAAGELLIEDCHGDDANAQLQAVHQCAQHGPIHVARAGRDRPTDVMLGDEVGETVPVAQHGQTQWGVRAWALSSL